MGESGKFEFPEYVGTTGALIYIRGRNGERLGRGHHRYDVLSGKNADGIEVPVLVGVTGWVVYILDKYSFYPIRFGFAGVSGDGFYDYRIEDGTLYGYRDDPNDATNLGPWPPEGAYTGTPAPDIDDDDI